MRPSNWKEVYKRTWRVASALDGDEIEEVMLHDKTYGGILTITHNLPKDSKTISGSDGEEGDIRSLEDLEDRINCLLVLKNRWLREVQP